MVNRMMSRVVPWMIVLSAAFAQVNDSSDRQARFEKASKAAREERIKSVTIQIAKTRKAATQARRNKRKGVFLFGGSSIKEIKKTQKRLGRELRELRNSRELVIPEISYEPKLGEIGRLPWSLEIDRVITDREMVVWNVRFWSKPAPTDALARSSLYSGHVYERQALIRGFDTTGMTDGQNLGSDKFRGGVFDVIGTEDVSGTRMLALEWVKLEDLIPRKKPKPSGRSGGKGP